MIESQTEVKEGVDFFELVNERRSVRIFDPSIAIPEEVMVECLEAAILSPNSSNLQLYNFIRVPSSSSIKDKLADLCMGQKAAKTAQELVVVVTRRDLWKSRAKANYDYIKASYAGKPDKKLNQALGYYGNLIPKLYRKFPGWSQIKQLIAWWVGNRRPMVREVSETDVRISVHKSASLASMTFMLALKSCGFDTCPMEGFDSKRVKKLLDLPKEAEICMVIGCGKGTTEGIYGKRFRVPSDQLYKTV